MNNRTKTSSVSPASRPHAQSRSSNASLTQNSHVTPKFGDRLSKQTTSNYMNNNVIEMQRKGSAGSSVGRPSSANSQKGKSNLFNNTTVQQPKRPVTPTLNKPQPTIPAAPPNITSNPTSPQKQAAVVNSIPSYKPTIQYTAMSGQAGQSPLKQGIPNSPSQHNNQDGQKVLNLNVTAPASVSRTASVSSVKSNGSTKPKSTTNTDPPKLVQNQANSNNNNSAKPQDAKPGINPITPKQSTKTFPAPISHQQRYSNSMSRSMVSLERSRNFRAFVEKAMNDHKIFSCCGVYPAIRNALKKRGWVEKPGPLAYSRSTATSLSHNKSAEDESDVTWMTRVLKEYPSDFIWVIRRDNIDWKALTKDQMINRFPKAWFTTKVGLAACLQHMHWFSEAGVADTFFPRCYRLCLEEERQAFQDDYRLTACMSYLRYFVDTFETKGYTALADVHSKITPLSVDFASRQLGNYIRMRRHEDIDWLLPPNFMTQHWDAFIHQYYAVVHERKRLRFDNAEAVHVKYETAKKTLQKVAQYWPQIQLDGVFNMWICKPGARSRGKGIVIMNTLEKIMDLMTQSNFRESNWVVQKYIEKPMLIYKTKYDIRQWFLITDWTPLTVWFYKESYVRFCTKPFVLEDFHESIHLCNNAIQCRYQNSEQRDTNLPDENMWSSDTFQAYLKTMGRLDAWPIIYSGMKQAIVGVLLASQETVESRKSCYELYGADFMLTEDFRPWLIEINSCPCMAASTSVTARMCAQCLEDTIKVVVDKKNNRNADTGMFEMIYRQNAGSVIVQQFSGHDLTIVGRKLTRDIDWPMTMSKSVTNTNTKKSTQTVSPMITQTQSTNKDNLTFSDLLQKLRVRNQQMFQGALATQQTQAESVVLEGTSGINSGLTNQDATGVLLNKMRSLRAQTQEQDLISGMRKVYPTSDPRQTTKRISPPPGMLSPTEKDTILLGDSPRRPSTPGKGEDPTIASKFADMNSLAYLMRNTHNTAHTIGDLIRISKEAAQDAMSKSTKRLDEKRQSHLDESQLVSKQVPKTLEEVRAMVEATSRQNSEKYGKTQSESKITALTINDNLQSSFVSESRESTTGSSPTPTNNPFTASHFDHSYKESANDDNDNVWIERFSSTHGTKNSLIQSSSQIIARKLINYFPNGTEEQDGYETPATTETIRRTKSLSVTLQPSQHSHVANNVIGPQKHLSNYSIVSTHSQPYMIYPEPAHPSHDICICNNEPETTEAFKQSGSSKETLNTYDSANHSRHEIEINDIRLAEEEQNKLSTSNTNQTNQPLTDVGLRQLLLEDLPLIDFTASDTTIQNQLQRAREFESNERDDPNGKLYQSILATTSDSDSDLNDDNNNEIILESHFIPSTYSFRQSQSVAVTVDDNYRQVSKSKSFSRLNNRRNTIPSSKRCSSRYPCHRVMLEPQNCQRHIKKKSAPTLPLKTINLLLPPNCNHF